MSSERIHRAIHVLGSHHSNSGLPRIAWDRLTLQEGHYNMSGKGQDSSQSWKCAYCKQYQKKGALFCQSCGWAKQDVAEYPENWYSQGGVTSWQQGWEQPKSPRAQRPWSPRRRQPESQPWGHVHGQGQGQLEKGKGKGKNKWNSQVPTLKDLPTSVEKPIIATPKTTVASSSSATTEEQKLLNLMLAHLAEKEDLPSNLQGAMAAYKAGHAKSEGKVMHFYVAKQTEAKTSLQKLSRDKQLFMNMWADYTCKVAETFSAQAKEMQETLEQFRKAEEQWQSQLQEASSQLARATGAADANAKPMDGVEEMEEKGGL